MDQVMKRVENVSLVVVLLLAASSAISQTRPAPATVPAGVRAQTNIPYVDNGSRSQILNVYLPEQPAEKPLPLVIWIHGGAWMGGNQANPPLLYLVPKGFAVASIQYRFSSE